jgi:hypothetical protein
MDEDRLNDLAMKSLDILMDNPDISNWTAHVAESELERKCRGEDDDEWFEHVGTAFDKLIDQMKKVNSVDLVKTWVN